MVAGPLVRVAALSGVAAVALPWRIRGQLYVTIVARATFSLAHGRAATIVDPEPIALVEIHHDSSPARSVRVATDLAPYLVRAEIVLTGHAYAPPGQAVETLAVRMSVLRAAGGALLDKTLLVQGELAPDGKVVPFRRMPLSYERAFGGIGSPDNPHGVGLKSGGPARPCVIYPGSPGRLAGFAPIARAVPVRKKLLAGVDVKKIEPGPRAIAELPDAFDWTYFQAAPSDQRIEQLDGNERLVLEGLHPALVRLETHLPGARALARVRGLAGDGWHQLELRADTLRIDVDTQRCSLTWRANVPVADEASLRALVAVAGVELPGSPIAWPAAPEVGAARPEASADKVQDRSETIALSDEEHADIERRGADLPFAARAKPAPAPPQIRSKHDVTTDLTPEQAKDAGSRPIAPFEIGQRRGPPAPAAPVPGAPWSAERAPAVPPPFGFATVDLKQDAPPPVELPRAITPIEPLSAPPAPAVDPSRFYPKLDKRKAAPTTEPDEHVAERTAEAIPLVPREPLPGCTVPWQIDPPQDSRTIVVKATFDLVAGGAAVLSDEQDPPTGDRYVDDDPARALLYASDLAVFKPAADVTFVGHAHAPGGARSCTVRVSLGDRRGGFSKTLAVFGDRAWVKNARGEVVPGEPERFERMPLTLERAFGGRGFAPNPTGIGVGGFDASGRARLPNLEDPARPIRTPQDVPPPACLAPLPIALPQRWSRIGTYDQRWVDERWPWFPADFDYRYWQAAPEGQQMPYLRGDEPFSIEGMHPEHGRLEGSLPGVRVRCFVQRTTAGGGAFEEVVMNLDTAAFDLDEMKLRLVWRGLIEVTGDDASDVADVLVVHDQLTGAPIALEAARDRRAALVAGRAAVPGALDEPAANDASGTAADPGASVRERLAAAGLPSSTTPDEAVESAPPTRPDDGVRVRALIDSGSTLDEADLSGAQLSNADLSKRSLRRAILKGAVLRGARLAGADLSGAVLAGADLTDASLEGADLSGADLAGADLSSAKLTGAKLDGADLTGVRADRADLRDARGAGVMLCDATWVAARFERAELVSSDFTRSSLDGAVFDDARLDEVRLYDARGPGASFAGASMPGARADGVSLVEASLRAAKASGSIWTRAKLDHTSFAGAKLDKASFERASCRKADFSGAEISEGRLGRARLEGATISRANLMNANLSGADLSGADLRDSNLYACDTYKAVLDGARLQGAYVAGTRLAGGGK